MIMSFIQLIPNDIYYLKRRRTKHCILIRIWMFSLLYPFTFFKYGVFIHGIYTCSYSGGNVDFDHI